MVEPVPTRPRRRWFRFSLRSLLVFTAVVGLLLGWIMKERRQSALEMEIAQELQKQGWRVGLGGPLDEYVWVEDEYVRVETESESVERLYSQTVWGRWARQLLGERVVTLDDGGVPPAVLFFDGTRVNDDLTPIANLTKLEWLSIRQTRVRDLAPLLGLKNLERFEVDRKLVTKEQIEFLQKALPNCTIQVD